MRDWTHVVRQRGWTSGILYLLSRLVERVSGGRYQFCVYALVAQPVHAKPLLPPRRGRNIEVRPVFRGDPQAADFPRPPEVIATRFASGARCLSAYHAGRFCGCIWLKRGGYDEDEARAHFVPQPEQQSVWDFDVYVDPQDRVGFVFLRLWDEANKLLIAEGVRWSMSRISLLNRASVASHERLGARTVGTATFLCGPHRQFMIASLPPYLHYAGPGAPAPVIPVPAPEREKIMSSASESCKTSHLVPESPPAGMPYESAAPAPSPAPVSLSARPRALVVGLCGHGLTIARGLAARGVSVLALEPDDTLPGRLTRVARVIADGPINDDRVVDTLARLGPGLAAEGPVALFLTNDNMVRAVAAGWPRLEAWYRLSWAPWREQVAPLVLKENLETYCAAHDLPYPASRLVGSLDGLDGLLAGLGYPVVVKPSRPLSSFKVRIVESAAEALELFQEKAAELPLLVQDWVPGGDDTVQFGALYLSSGRVVARFEGRKVRARPMGHTTIAEPRPDDQVHALAARFFAPLGMSGAVSLEVKRGPDGRLWIIEPTIGRTDFWLGVCIANGVDLTWLEYLDNAGQALPAMSQERRALWINSERDPGAWAWFVAERLRPGGLGLGIEDLYLSLRDPLPMLRHLWHTLRRVGGWAWRRRPGAAPAP